MLVPVRLDPELSTRCAYVRSMTTRATADHSSGARRVPGFV